MTLQAPAAATILAIEFSLLGIAAVAILARIHLRLRIQRRKFSASDIWICLAWPVCTLTSCFDIIFARLGVLEPEISFTLEGYGGTPEEIEFLWKLQWAGEFPFFTAFFLTKAALLAFYAQLFPPYLRKRRFFLRTTMVYCACAYATTVLLKLLICRPTQRYWSLDPATACPVIVYARVFQVGWSLNFLADILIFCLPFLVIFELHMRRIVKISLYCIFLLGVINLAFSLTRFLVIQSSPSDFRSFSLIELWSILDMNTGLIIACLPALRPYLPSLEKAFPLRSASMPFSAASKTTRGIFETTDEPQLPEPALLRGQDRGVTASTEQTDQLGENGQSDIQLIHARGS